MTLLALDTATQFISIALHDGQQMLAEQTWISENHHTVELAPAVRALLVQSHLAFTDLTALAVAIGPGSYTGLRIGVALAKGIAAAHRLPLVGVSTLDILAAGQPQSTGALILVLPAGRGRVVTARYHWRKGQWKLRGEAQNMDWNMLIASIDGPATLSGEISADGHAAVDAAIGSGLPVALTLPALRMRRAGFLAEEAWTRLRASGDKSAFEAASVAPIYVKTKDSPRTSLTLRYMRLPDIPEVTVIDHLSFDPSWSARSYQFEINESTYSYMVVLEYGEEKAKAGWRKLVPALNGTHATDGQIVGYGGLWNIMDEAHISTIATHPDHRGKGWGEIVLAGMIRRAIVLNAEYVVLEVRVSNHAAQNLYTKYGFHTVATKPKYYHSNNEDAFEMRLNLDHRYYRARFEERYAKLIERHDLTDRYTEADPPRKLGSSR